MHYAPIALFTYNRPDKTQTVIESLLQNAEAKDSELFIFSDGAKNEKAVEGVKANREYLHSLKNSLISNNKENAAFKGISIIEREKNWGLANSLIAGITELCDKYGRVIVVEDDLILSPYFLKFMNDGLEKYKDEERVSAISGFLNPVGGNIPNTFFLRYFACWGWATWKRAWDLFNPDVRDLLKKLRWKKNDFNIGGTGPFYAHLYCHKVGEVDTWAARFYASSFIENKLVLFPGRSLTIQSGIDGSGTHSGNDDSTFNAMQLSNSPICFDDIPVVENNDMYNAYSRFYGQGKKKDVKYQYDRFKSFIRRLLGVDYR